MTNNENEFDFVKKKYPLEDALEKLVKEIILLLGSVRRYIGRKPESKFEMILKALEIIVWVFLSYDLVRAVVGR